MTNLSIKCLTVLMILLAAYCAEAAGPAFYRPLMTNQMVEAQLSRHLAKGAVAVKPLAALINRLAKKYDVDQQHIIRVVLHESKGKEFAYNSKSKDHGLMQINERTADDRKLDLACLYTWQCNLEAGVRIISDLQNAKDFRICLYNIGKKGLKRKPKACAAYERKLACLN